MTDKTPTADLSASPLPTKRTLAMRRNLPYQVTRFLNFNVRIMRMVRKGHH